MVENVDLGSGTGQVPDAANLGTTTYDDSGEERPTTRLGSIRFDFQFPQLKSSGSGKAVTHEVVPLSEHDDGATVIQPMGREAREWTLRGDCYRRTANELDALAGEVVELRHVRHSGDVFVADVSTDPTGQHDDGGWRYTYNLSLTEVV